MSLNAQKKIQNGKFCFIYFIRVFKIIEPVVFISIISYLIFQWADFLKNFLFCIEV